MENNSSRLRKRIVELSGKITHDDATRIVAELLFLDREDSTAPIQLHIHPLSAPIYTLQAIHDTMQNISAPVSTMAFDYTASFSTVILADGEQGLRFVHTYTAIELYQEQALPDILKEELIETYMRHSGKDFNSIKHDLDNRLILNPEQAIEYGLIDDIL